MTSSQSPTSFSMIVLVKLQQILPVFILCILPHSTCKDSDMLHVTYLLTKNFGKSKIWYLASFSSMLRPPDIWPCWTLLVKGPVYILGKSIKYHCCWWPGSVCLHVISSYGNISRINRSLSLPWGRISAIGTISVPKKWKELQIYTLCFFTITWHVKGCLSLNSLWAISGSTLAQIYCLMTTSHYLNQCWIIMNEVL